MLSADPNTPVTPNIADALSRGPGLDPGVPLVTPWVVIPLAVIAMLFLAGHIMNLRSGVGAGTNADMPESRRRIRLANGWLMMLLAPIAAIAFSIVTPGQSREFVLMMTLVVGMLGLIVIMACTDAVNNLRLHRIAMRELQHQIAQARLDAQVEEARKARASESSKEQA